MTAAPDRSYDVAVIGAGIAGMSSAARLQAAGLRTLLLEAHSVPGGCAGYFRTRGFAFDVGATTLVDFEPGGVGGEFFKAIGMPSLAAHALPGYEAWLPNGNVVLHRDPAAWQRERLRAFGDTAALRAFWRLFDRLAGVFWSASRAGVKLPVQSCGDVVNGLRQLGLSNLTLLRYLRWTVGDALRAFGLRDHTTLCALLAMLIEDTVHATLDEAPLVNGVLGATIRGAGLSRARGGMFGFWRAITAHYRALGGDLRVGTAVRAVSGHDGAFVLDTTRGRFHAGQVVNAIPAQLAARIGPAVLAEALAPYLRRDADRFGGAIVVFVGVPEATVAGQAFTHHQLLHDFAAPLGNGNNMFISVSAPDDLESAPRGERAVMISTHCELAPWHGLGEREYRAQKQAIGDELLARARRVYPALGDHARVYEIATPRTYERYTRRPGGAVGGVRLTLRNSNQHAIPHDLGIPGLFLCGDTTWPGLGTVAGVLGSRIVARAVLARSGLRRTTLSRVPVDDAA